MMGALCIDHSALDCSDCYFCETCYTYPTETESLSQHMVNEEAPLLCQTCRDAAEAEGRQINVWAIQ